ncbi:MAG: hypothetical protein QOH49_2566, partial [Acidobacteriota bacterium]|nr:hypothetical protein [Acidobacteriota bacterium]
LKRPGLTAERFMPDAFSTEAGARLYRTGDLARYRADGVVEYLGRADQQVKLRGFRIELGEVEAALRQHPSVKDAAVLARVEGAAENRLVAYVVSVAGESVPGADELRAYISTHLPEYMVPSAFVRMDELPTTPGGKIDRRALPAPDAPEARPGDDFELPQTPTEEVVASVWAEVLGRTPGRSDNFFELGGHSLMAMQVMSRVRKAFGVELRVRALFERPTLEGICTAVDEARGPEPETQAPAVAGKQAPLSFEQQRLWFIDQLEPGSAAYNVPAAVRLDGALNVEALERTLNEVVRRHESLRTTFAVSDGLPVQVIHAALPQLLKVVDLSGIGDAEQREGEARRLAGEEARQPFDLSTGPLLRASLLKLSDEEHVLLFTMHHIVSDGWSMGVLVREVSALYSAFSEGEASPLRELPMQYADFAARQRELLTGEVLEEQMSFWREQLGGDIALLELPTDRPRPVAPTYAGARQSASLSMNVTDALKQLSLAEGSTLFMTLLAAFNALLARHTNQHDILVGTPVAGRTSEEVEGLIGFFVNTLVLRTDLSGDPTFRELLRRVREVTLGAYSHQDVPFEKLVGELRPEREAGGSPFFNVMFTFQNASEVDLRLNGLRLSALPAEGETAKFDLSLDLFDTAQGLGCVLKYRTELFDDSTARRILRRLVMLLERVAADPDACLADLPLLTEEDRRFQLFEFNATDADYPASVCVHELFERQAAATPDATAVVFRDQSLTYGELNSRANRVGAELAARGVGRGSHVPVLLDRSLELVVSLLAVMKTGAAFSPLDVNWPVERLRRLLDDLGNEFVLVNSSTPQNEEELGRPCVLVDASVGGDAAPNLNAAVRALDPLYVIYTSGSTGEPKGVLIPHRGIVNRFSWMSDYLGADAATAALQTTRHVYDSAVWQLFWPLTTGGKTIVPSPEIEMSADYLADLIGQHGITIVDFVPSVFNSIVPMLVEDVEARAKLSSLRCVVLGGEAITPTTTHAFKERFPATRVLNLYGPTEASIGCVCYEVRGDEGGRIPIGRPISNARILILDHRRGLVPVGVPGQIYISGACLGLGYLNDAEKTAATFVPNPFHEIGYDKLYKTGDAARWLADGQIQFLGRLDGQLKIRGFRIEPGEIEAKLTQLRDVHSALVLVREDEPGDKRLVAYVVAREGASLDAEELRAHLSRHLPYYMIPSGFVMLPELPQTIGYKIDRKALLALTPPEAEKRATYVAPRTAVEEVVAGVWAEVLRVERVGVRDNFFELGGHSLLATQVVARLRKVWGIELPLRRLFEEPTVAGLAQSIETLLQDGGAALAPSPRSVTRGQELLLSLAQQRLWFIDQLEPGSAAYNLPAAVRLKGALDVSALEHTLDEVVRRHESLRTTFAVSDGLPVQVIHAALPQLLKVVDLSGIGDAEQREGEARRLAGEEARQPFDLSTGPLLRASLLRLHEEEHVLLFTMHHIVSDGWSMGVLVREVSALYAAFAQNEESPLAELPLQYADYAAWQRNWLTDEVLEGQLSYWRKQLGGELPVLELPTDRPRPVAPTYAGARQSVNLSKSVADALKAISLEEGSTLFMTLLAAFNALLARHAGQEDIAVGTPIANRTSEDIEGLIGFFVNTLVMRTDLAGDPTFRELVRRVREVSLGAYSHQDVPFEKLVEELRPERNLNRNPLFQVMFIHQNASDRTLELPGLSLSPFQTVAASAAQFDLTLIVADTGDGLAAALEYQSDLFDEATIARMLGHFRLLLEGIASGADSRISDLPLLSEVEHHQLVQEWNDTRVEYDREAHLHRLIEEQVARTPDAVAVSFEGEELTYRELNSRANRLARFLRARGVERGTRVGICVERSIEMMVGLLGIVKSGGAYVPLDPAYPRERLSYMLEDARVPVLLTQERLADGLPQHDAQVVRLDADRRLVEAFDGGDLEDELTPDDLAYVIYTSGSTGKPKGAMNTHRAICNRLLWMQDAYGLGPEDRVMQKTPFSFDVSVWEFFWPLLTGARLVVARPGGHQDSSYISDLIDAERITTLHFVPSMLSVFLEEQKGRPLPSLRRVICSGEALPFELQERFFASQGAELHNLYGPTEAAVDVTYWACRRDGELRTVPIGQPIANTQIYLLDSRLRPVPVGVGGELHIGGVNVGRGYLGRPGLTAEKFIPDPFSVEPGARLYKTGDLARFLPGGEIEYVGRLDYQVKVRGFRIELGEIEAALARHPSVRECAVLVKEEQGDKRLFAYLVAPQGADTAALRSHLKSELPDYMIPSGFVVLPELPLTPNGKLDRRALVEATPAGPAAASSAYVAPRTAVEEVVAGVWGEVLRVGRVGTRDDFFELGGHSLLATRVASRLRDVFGVALPLRRLFEQPTVEALSRTIEDGLREDTQTAVAPPITRAHRDGGLPLSFAQQRLWFLEQLEPGGAAYNLSTAVRLDGRLDVDALGRALAEVVRRHESLRTKFESVKGRPVQIVRDDSDFALEVDDLCGVEPAEHEALARRLAREEARRPFDLTSGNLLRARLLRLSEEEHVMLMTMHHIVSDGWSMNVLVREVSALYSAFAKNEESPLAELSIQYADFAAWQRGWLKGEALEAEMSYWRRQLTGALPLLELPTDRPRPAVKRYRGALESLTVPAEVSDALKRLSLESGATLFMTLLAGFKALLRRYTNQDDILVGTPVANRNRVEIEGLIGFFVNTLVLRTDLSGDPTFRELLRDVKEAALGAYTHQDVPFEKLVDELQPERNLSHSPLFQVMFTLHATEAAAQGETALRMTPLEAEGTSAKFDLTLDVAETASGLAATFEYDTDLFDAATVRRMLDHFSALLSSIVENPDARISSLTLLGEEERRRILSEFNQTGRVYPRATLHGLFEAQVARTPTATALVCG